MRGAVAALGLVLAGWPVAAAAQTAITPDVTAGRALGTTVGQAGTVFTIDGGTRAGANLFHSFSHFDLGAGDTAQWVRGGGDGAAIANVVNRVTGGQASTIAGTLDSTALPNAAFWFINPAGIVFGAGAQVNVPGAAHFSTAAELRFADGLSFAVAAPDGSTLSMAAPEAFGFVGAQGDIALAGVQQTFAPATASLSFSAADVSVTGSQFAAGGLDVIGVGDGAAEVRVADPLSGARAGTVSLQDSRINVFTADAPGAPLRVSAGEIRLDASNLISVTTGAGRGGDVALQAGQVLLGPDAFVLTSASGAGAGGDVRIDAGLFEIDSRAATTTTGLTSIATAAGGAGAIALEADTIRLLGEVGNTTGSGFAIITSTVTGSGAAGAISLDATNIEIDVALISSFSFGDGDGGDIRMTAPNQFLGAATVVTGALGVGGPGDLNIDGDRIVISGGQFGATPGSSQASGGLVINATTSIESDGGGFLAISSSPNAFGNVTLRAPLIFLSQGNITTQAFDEGLAGRILVEADTLLLDRLTLSSDSADGPLNTGVAQLRSSGDLIVFQGSYSVSANGTADGGRIEFEGRNVLVDGAFILSTTGGFGTGDAGQVSITAGEDLLITNAAFINSTSDSIGQGGNVSLRGRNIEISNQSLIASDADFIGNAGSIDIVASDRLDLDSVQILSKADSGTGDGGTIRIEAGRLFMTDASVSSDSESFGRAGTVQVRAGQMILDGNDREFTGISSDAFFDGDAGSVTIDAGSLVLRNGAYVSSSAGLAGGSGRAGSVVVRTADLTLVRGGYITTIGIQTDGGDISINATGDVTLVSEPGFNSLITSAATGGDAGDLSLTAGGALSLDGAVISSDTFGPGDAGSLSIKAGSITLENASGISSSTDSFGNAGALSIEARTITLNSGSVFLSAATPGSQGDAKSITIKADDITVGETAAITTTTFGAGNAGAVDITAKSLRIDGGEVSSSADLGATGVAGDVSIVADDLAVVNEGLLTTLSSNENKAGTLRIAAGQITVENLSQISSANLADHRGDAGEVFITAGGVRLSNGGVITTNSVAGAAGNIEIRIDRPGLLVLEGEEFAGAILTSSGPGTGGAITITDPLAIVSNGGRILALGEQRGANVVIQSRYFINSTDRRNIVEVDGEFQLETGLYDVSSGITSRDISVLDASKVLRGQCPAARSTGAVSQLITRPVGPYARENAVDVLDRPAGAAASPFGSCP